MPLPQVLGGVHENLHSVRYLDVYLRKCSSMLDCLSDADLLLTCVTVTGCVSFINFRLPDQAVALA